MKNTAAKIGSLLLAILLVFSLISGIASADGSDKAPFFKSYDLFSDRDMKQIADISGAEYFTVTDGAEIRIDKAGVYVISGSASDATVFVEASKDDKVQLVLDSVNITNKNFPCIYVDSADKVFITLLSDSSLTVTDFFRSVGNMYGNGVIYSRDDLVLNGTASLTIVSSEDGIVCKDDLKITGGTYVIESAYKALDANDSIRIADGTFTLTAGTDALHAENNDDETKGYIYIGAGSFTINSEDEGILATYVVQIDGGTVDITAPDGIKAFELQINGGTVTVNGEEVSSNGI